ncbi:TPR-like protein [Dioscorea alata]|uniref:TPR-like protein n=1 Tax=Dioscorea alata TaxID=55571 RepID=A0ACB7WS84_DIOAL|nr:TPR-like protein [Dioscorea alata]
MHAIRSIESFVHSPKLSSCSSLLRIPSPSPSSSPFDRYQSPNSNALPPDPCSYTNLIVSYAKQAVSLRARNLFDETPERTKTLLHCKIIHCRVLKFGFWVGGSLGNALVDLYAKCGDLDNAWKVFDRLAERDASAWNSVLSAHARWTTPVDVVSLFREMQCSGCTPDRFGLAIALSACARLSALDYGRCIHCDVVKLGFCASSHCEGALIDMYAKCDNVLDARLVFDGVQCPDTISWTTMIAGYARIGMSEEAFELFLRMRDVGGTPDQVTFVTVIAACLSSGRLDYARSLFMQMPSPNGVAWNSIISGYAQNGHEDEALELFREMRGKGVKPTRSTLGSLLSAIANLMAIYQGQQVHCEAIRLGLDSNVFVGSSLINMYAKCCRIEDASNVFTMLPERNLVVWNAMLSGYMQNGNPNEATELYIEMKRAELQLDEFSFVSAFSACAMLENVDLGRQLHSAVVKGDFDGSLYVGNAVVDMYAKCGALNDAKRQFELILNRDIVSWNALIVGFVRNEAEDEALSMFRRMRLERVVPDEVSFASIISACTSIQALEEGKQMHCLSIKFDLGSDVSVGSSLIDLYAKHGEMDVAEQVFRRMPEQSLVPRNVIITGHVQNSNEEEAFNVFRQMQIDNIEPSRVTFASILSGFSGPLGLRMGTQVHSHILKSGLHDNDEFLGVSLLGMYLKCKAIEDANRFFHEMSNSKSLVLWTSLISGHIQNGQSEDGLLIFRTMLNTLSIMPDEATFASVLKACADLADLRVGKTIHAFIIQTGFCSHQYTTSALIDMYSKCGDVNDSFLVFEELKNKHNVISWNSIIVGYAKNGYAGDALNLFQQMQQLQVKPDDITFLGVLTACSHGGLVSKGRDLFNVMVNKYRITPRTDHYACMIDLLGRSGNLKEAEEFINDLPFKPDGVIWATMLGACRIHGDDARAQRAAEKLIELEPHNSSPYVMLSNICAASGNWMGAKMVRETMRERGVRKSPGCSWIVSGKKTSLFVAGDQTHPDYIDIHAALKVLTAAMKNDGSVADVELLQLNEE